MINRNQQARRLLDALDDAIDEYDGGSSGTVALHDALTAIARATESIDPAFADRAGRVAERAIAAADPSQRDIASVLARDVRRDLMCGAARLGPPRNPCAPDAKNADDPRAHFSGSRHFTRLPER